MKKTGLCLLVMFLLRPGFTQDTIVMPVNGSGGFFNTCYATIFDNGLDSNYADHTNSTITIAPLWVENVSLYFEIFELETFFDQLFIYDGPSQTFPLIGTYSGTQLQGQTITSTGTSITLKFISDDVENGPGFKAWVSCAVGLDENAGITWKVYPDPADTYLMLDGINVDEIKKIQVLDMTGRVVETRQVATALDVQAFVPGPYLLVLEKNDGHLLYTRWIKK